jgi:hypothetical protein
MDQKLSDLTDAAWVSRFWAFYRQLPEPLKEGFIGIVQTAQGIEKAEQQVEGKGFIKAADAAE